MKISFLPKSVLGKWSSGLTIAGILLTVIMIVLSEILGIINSRIIITTSGILSIIMLLTPCVTGIIAIIKSKDKSVMVYFAALVGLLTAVFLVVARFSPE